MVKYLVGAAIGAVAVYAVLELWPLSDGGPDFKVWVKQTHIPRTTTPTTSSTSSRARGSPSC